ncbi:MAG: N-acetylmuramic acid 6-phosphate etherase [Verrucomicrobiota bacterium]|nr:N-acetylmuramic acid 6-phosphate etherase [Verrucomicrobiota bacterium]
MESAKRVLGIEGGGTKTDWIVLEYQSGRQQTVDQGRLPAANLKLASDQALAGLFAVLPLEVTHVGAFLAGCGTEADRHRLRTLVEARWPHARIAIGSDRDSGLATAFGDGDGIVVIAGTGAAVHGRRGGRIEKAGGWGQLLGDRGGGYHLAMQGLRLVLSQYDLDQQITPLAQNILRTLGLNRLQDLVDWAMQADKMSVARLAPAVFEAARSGEGATLAIVQNGAGVLAQFTRAVARRLEFASPPVKLLGGLFTHHPEYAALFDSRLQVLLPGAAVEICGTSGALGAAWLASREKPESGGEPREEMRPDMAAELARAATEQSNPRSVRLDQLSTGEFIDLFVREEHHVAGALAACREALIAAVDITSAALRAGGRLFYVGAGTSGRLGVLDASEIPPTFGAPPDLVQGIIAGGAAALHRAVEGAEDQAEAGALVMLDRGVTARDVVCGISASGRTPFVFGALEGARKVGAGTLLLTCNPARLPAHTPWDVEIDLPTGPEIVTGSTRLKAGTATKVALNIISTGAMVRLGKVRGNAMIDLAVSNAKLRDRAARLVSTALEISYEEACERLERVGWNVRAALP